jgi:hypothetical protein
MATTCACCGEAEGTSPVEGPEATVLFCEDCASDREYCPCMDLYIEIVVTCDGCERNAIYEGIGEYDTKLHDSDERYCESCAYELLVQCCQCEDYYFKDGDVRETAEGTICAECEADSEASEQP